MARSSSFNHIAKKLKRDIKGSYLTIEDIRQEYDFAVFLAFKQNKNVDLHEHLSGIIQQAKREETSCLYFFDQRSDPLELILAAETKKKLIKIVNNLIERCSVEQKIILRLMYGFSDGRYRNHGEMASLLNISEEKVAEIEREAMLAIRSHGGIDFIKKFIK